MSTLYERVWSRYGRDSGFLPRIRSQMITHGIPQAALARRAGCQESHLSRWLNGHVTPNLENRLILDEALDQLIDELTT